MKKFFIYQDIENCFYCTEIESKIKGWVLVGTFTGIYSLIGNNDFEEFKSGEIIDLTNGKHVLINKIEWNLNFTLADFKNFKFKHGQVVMLKNGDILKLLGVNFDIENYEDGILIDTLDPKDNGRRWICLDEILNIYMPKPIDAQMFGISLQ